MADDTPTSENIPSGLSKERFETLKAVGYNNIVAVSESDPKGKLILEKYRPLFELLREDAAKAGLADIHIYFGKNGVQDGAKTIKFATTVGPQHIILSDDFLAGIAHDKNRDFTNSIKPFTKNEAAPNQPYNFDAPAARGVFAVELGRAVNWRENIKLMLGVGEEAKKLKRFQWQADVLAHGGMFVPPSVGAIGPQPSVIAQAPQAFSSRPALPPMLVPDKTTGWDEKWNAIKNTASYETLARKNIVKKGDQIAADILGDNKPVVAAIATLQTVYKEYGAVPDASQGYGDLGERLAAAKAIVPKSHTEPEVVAPKTPTANKTDSRAKR